jgi:hypothetical protein
VNLIDELFELHAPMEATVVENLLIYCAECETDYPCYTVNLVLKWIKERVLPGMNDVGYEYDPQGQNNNAPGRNNDLVPDMDQTGPLPDTQPHDPTPDTTRDDQNHMETEPPLHQRLTTHAPTPVKRTE